MISADDKTKKERANKVYGLPLISQTVQYLHTAAGFLTEETWIKAIKGGNFNTRPTITPSIVRHYFPESDKNNRAT